MKKKGKAPNASPEQLREAARRGMDRTMVFCLSALSDKMGFETEDLVRFIRAVSDIADSVLKGYVSYDDLHNALKYEQGLEW